MPGTCSGCGFTSQSCKRVANHVPGCPEYAELYLRDPEACLTPQEEHVRRKAVEADPELRAANREVKLNRIFAEVDMRRQRETDRFMAGAVDPLADD